MKCHVGEKEGGSRRNAEKCAFCWEKVINTGGGKKNIHPPDISFAWSGFQSKLGSINIIFILQKAFGAARFYDLRGDHVA